MRAVQYLRRPDDVAHYPHHQAPDVVVPAALDFLATLPRQAAGR